jgi:hypothetical protein
VLELKNDGPAGVPSEQSELQIAVKISRPRKNLQKEQQPLHASSGRMTNVNTFDHEYQIYKRKNFCAMCGKVAQLYISQHRINSTEFCLSRRSKKIIHSIHSPLANSDFVLRQCSGLILSSCLFSKAPAKCLEMYNFA